MRDKLSISEVQLSNILSFGSDSPPIVLESLNIIIGPNATGKSNFVDIIWLISALPIDIRKAFRPGGAHEWPWKGAGHDLSVTSVEITLDNVSGSHIDHGLNIYFDSLKYNIDSEFIRKFTDTDEKENIYQYINGEADVTYTDPDGFDSKPFPGILKDQSVLAQLKDPTRLPHITELGAYYSSIRLYREWNLSRFSPPRLPQSADLPEEFLLEDASNLALVINNLFQDLWVKRQIISHLQEFYSSIEDISTKVQGGTVQLYLHERGLMRPIPATRISDGTLRYLCLLSILCHPSPPPLICIEEPELGMHPDMMPAIASLLKEASQRTQLIVTTHSDLLLSQFTDTPKCVLVCEKDEGGTTMRRLDEEKLKEWLNEYSLGDLWLKGEIGGTRW